jgi:hypothetical protein
VFHLFQSCSDNIVMMDVWSDALGRVEPQAVNQIEITGRQGRRMGAKMVGVRASASMMDDEPNIEGLRLVRSFPGLPEQACLVGR